jgi:hypothetical protein
VIETFGPTLRLLRRAPTQEVDGQREHEREEGSAAISTENVLALAERHGIEMSSIAPPVG